MALFTRCDNDWVIATITGMLHRLEPIRWSERNRYHGHRGELINRLAHEIENINQVLEYAIRSHSSSGVIQILKKGRKVRNRWTDSGLLDKRMMTTQAEREEWHLERAVSFATMKHTEGFGRF